MIKHYFASSINIFLRGITVIGRLLIILFIGKYLSVQALGIYSLFFTTIVLATLLLGLDFYTFRTREILSQTCTNKMEMIRDQFIFHFIGYLIILPVLLLIFWFDILSNNLIHIFYLILIMEHLSQEFFRLFTALSKPIWANIIFFIRTSAWVYILILLVLLNHLNFNLLLVFDFWLTGSTLSVILSLAILWRMDLGSFLTPIQWDWIKKGIKVSMPFFISTIAYKTIEFSNRYFIDFLLTKDDVGVFSFFASFANTVQVFVFTGVIMLIYPKMIQAYGTDKKEYGRLEKNLKLYTILFSICICLLVFFITPYILKVMDKNIFSEQLPVLWILLLSMFIFNMSLIPHYCLYIKKYDMHIMFITLSGAAINIILNMVLINLFGLIGASLSLLFTFTFILILKYYVNLKADQNVDKINFQYGS